MSVHYVTVDLVHKDEGRANARQVAELVGLGGQIISAVATARTVHYVIGGCQHIDEPDRKPGDDDWPEQSPTRSTKVNFKKK